METKTKVLIAGGLALAFVAFRKAPSLTTSAKNIGDLNQLTPTARAKVTALLARMDALGIPFKVMETLRSRARQEQLFAQGRTAPGQIVTHVSGKPGDESRHQSGNAADLVLDVSRWPAHLGPKPTGAYDQGVDNGVIVRPQVLAAWKTMGREAQALGLRWLGGPSGGALNKLTGLAFDAPHVEVPA